MTPREPDPEQAQRLPARPPTAASPPVGGNSESTSAGTGTLVAAPPAVTPDSPTVPNALPSWDTLPLPEPFEEPAPTAAPPASSRRRAVWHVATIAFAWIVAVLVLGAAFAAAWWLIAPQLSKPYAYDEAAFAFAGHAVAQTGIPFSNVGHIQEETPGDFSQRFNWALWHPPLYLYALGAAFHRWGESETTARLVGVVCNAIAALLIFLAGTVLLAGRSRAAPVYAAAGAAVYALNPLVLQSALLLDIDGTVLVASIALMALTYALLLRSGYGLRHPLTWLLLGLAAFSFALSLWAKMTTSLAIIVAATVCRLMATRPWRPWRVLVELPVVVLFGGALFLSSWWAFAALKGMPFWFPFRILELEFAEAAGSTAAWRDNPRVLLELVSHVALWVSPYLILLFAWVGLARLYDVFVAPLVSVGRRLARRPHTGEPWGMQPIDFALASGAAIGAAYLIKLAGSFPKYHISMMPFWAIAVAYVLCRFVPSISWWEVPVYGVVLAGLAGYFVSFVGDRYVLFAGWDFLFPLLVWPAALGFAFLVLGAALQRYYLPRQLAILSVLLTIAWSWGVDRDQSVADYNTTYNYRTNGQRETAAFLDTLLRPGEPYVAPRDVAYYVNDDMFVDQDVWQAYVERLADRGVTQFDGRMRLGPGADYDVRTVAVFLWEPTLGQQAHAFLDSRYDVIYQSGPAGPYFVFQRFDP